MAQSLKTSIKALSGLQNGITGSELDKNSVIPTWYQEKSIMALQDEIEEGSRGSTQG